jgi:hypothetical protein
MVITEWRLSEASRLEDQATAAKSNLGTFDQYTAAILTQVALMAEGDVKAANQQYERYAIVLQELVAAGHLSSLASLLDHVDPVVRLTAATDLLAENEARSTEVLESLMKSGHPDVCFEAEVVLTEWRAGNLTTPREMIPEHEPEVSPEYQRRLDEAQRIRTYRINGKDYKRIPYGKEDSEWHADDFPCHDCETTKGQLHLPGCDVEQCPRCGGQAIGCGCDYAPYYTFRCFCDDSSEEE